MSGSAILDVLAGEVDPSADPLRLRAILDAIPQIVWSTRPDGHHDFYNQRWYDFTGREPGTTDGEGWSGMFHPDDQDRAWKVWRRSLATGEPYEIEYRLRHHSGEYRWTLGRALPVRDEDGAIVRWYGTCTDIDDFRKAKEERELIASELSHRIKNIFAVISSLVALSAREHPESEEFAEVVRERIGSLAVAHAYVMPAVEDGGGRGESSLLALMGQLLMPYQGSGAGERIKIVGDDTPVGVHAATALALIVHELATNAVKYGALSLPRGQVRITSVCRGDNHEICWEESGGPSVPGTPARRGFGTKMSRRLAEAQLQASIIEEWLPEGLRFSLQLPVRSLQR